MHDVIPNPPPHTTEQVELKAFTDEVRKCPVINWYRTSISAADRKALHIRSDAKAWVQTLGYIGIVMATGVATIVAWAFGPWWLNLVLLFLHGTVSAFAINGVHELGHGTVFQTKRWNTFFCEVLAFFGWINHVMFQASHTRHHRYTLHPPDDLEVVLPVRLLIRHFFLNGFVKPDRLWGPYRTMARLACGRFVGEWELTLFPPEEPDKRRPVVRWARIVLAGHGLIAAVSLALGWWIVPVVVSFTPAYGAWLFFLCNNTQHVGLQDNVPDFRLCCRTFTLAAPVRFLYWQMNYHTEHHMYAAVPCYHLARLHELIKHDLPPCPDGLVAVWTQILTIQRRQDRDPSYRYAPPLPEKARA